MTINDLIYIHIPKTGGWSMHNTLKSVGFTKKNGHKFGGEIKGIMGDSFDDHFKFTIVRDPWSRLLSSYTFLSTGSDVHRPPEHKEFLTLGVQTFESFIHKLYEINKNEDDIYILPHNKTHRVNLFTLNQVNWVSGVDVNYIGYLGDLEESMNRINEMTGINIPIPPKGNTTKHDNPTDVYTTELIDIVSEMYHKDITKFNFKFND
jgi:hypothetical protein